MSNQYIVFIADEGIKDIGDVLQQWSVQSKIGTYFTCSSLNASGSYVHVEIIETDSNNKEVKYEMEIPHRYIKIIITGSDINQIGFLPK